MRIIGNQPEAMSGQTHQFLGVNGLPRLGGRRQESRRVVIVGASLAGAFAAAAACGPGPSMTLLDREVLARESVVNHGTRQGSPTSRKDCPTLRHQRSSALRSQRTEEFDHECSPGTGGTMRVAS
jgi:hypothetical protein